MKIPFNDDANWAASRLSYSWLTAPSIGLVQVLDIQSNRTNKLSLSKVIVASRCLFIGNKELNWGELLYDVGSLGYVGDRYITRAPLRKSYKQGLTANTLIEVLPSGAFSGVAERFISENVIKIQCCIDKKFKKVSSIIDDVEERGISQPLSQSFCLDKQYNLLYKTRKVGKLTKEDRLKLENKFSFLAEELARDIGNEHISL